MTSLDFLPPSAGVYVAKPPRLPSQSSASEMMPDYDHTRLAGAPGPDEQAGPVPAVTAMGRQG